MLVQEELKCCGAEPVIYWVDEPETRVRVCVSSARETTRRLGRCVLAWHTNVCDQPGVNRGGFYEKSDRQVREQQTSAYEHYQITQKMSCRDLM